MLTKLYVNANAVVEAERYALNLVNKNPHLAHWLPYAYHICSSEFENPKGSVFEYNLALDKVIKHTCFSNFFSDLTYHFDVRNMPVRSILNGVGSTELAALLFALYAVFVYLRVNI